jgi:dipeptidyl aminopeptidase/acylaminoacyl peptidase
MNRALIALGAGTAVLVGVWAASGAERPPAAARQRVRLEGSERPSWSPDGTQTAFRVRDRERRVRLFVADARDAATLLPVSAETAPDRDVLYFAWSPDGSRLAYTADEDLEGVYELYTVRPDGQERRKISPALPDRRSVVWFSWSPDGTSLLYVADQDVDDRFDLYTIPSAGGDPSPLSSGMPADADVQAVGPERP